MYRGVPLGESTWEAGFVPQALRSLNGLDRCLLKNQKATKSESWSISKQVVPFYFLERTPETSLFHENFASAS